jgi:hypothetical protein
MRVSPKRGDRLCFPLPFPTPVVADLLSLFLCMFLSVYVSWFKKVADFQNIAGGKDVDGEWAPPILHPHLFHQQYFTS